MEIIGAVHLELYAASTAKDTDFTASVIDVFPDGRAVEISAPQLGIVRARYRNGYDKEEFLTPGKIEKYRIDLGHMGHAFLPGHQIRVQISSSMLPKFHANPNTGNPIATDTDAPIKAEQTIYHEKDYPSALVIQSP